jgi:hypothetical protein
MRHCHSEEPEATRDLQFLLASANCGSLAPLGMTDLSERQEIKPLDFLQPLIREEMKV